MVLGSRGMVGSAIVRNLQTVGNVEEIIPASRSEVDLTQLEETRSYIASERPDFVVVAAAKVGGIIANNNYPRDFLFQNLAIELNVIDSCFQLGIERLLFLGSSCIYPKYAEQPIREEFLLTGTLEPTNEPYAIAKICGIKLCESYNRQFDTDYRSLMPCNLYGPGDDYHPENSHVIPALIRKVHEAKMNGQDVVSIWGTGKARREFLFVDDLAAAVVHVMQLEKACIGSVTAPLCSHINVGYGDDVSISELAYLIRTVVDVDVRLEFDVSKPDGTPRKLMDSSKLRALGWEPKIDLSDGLQRSYRDFTDALKG